MQHPLHLTLDYGSDQGGLGPRGHHFVPLLAVYRRELSDADATTIFGVYALGLIRGFLIGGPA